MKITLTIIIFLIFLGACSEIPDLQEAGILKEANKEAIALGKLNRKLMYGMFPLYVDAEEEPYTGWTKEIDPNTKAKTLGYLKISVFSIHHLNHFSKVENTIWTL